MKPNTHNLTTFYNGVMKGDSPLYAYQFVATFNFPEDQYKDLVDELQSNTEPANNLSYYIQTSTIPGVEVTTAKSTFFGTEFKFPGTVKYAHNFSCNILLTQDMRIYHILHAWMKHISDLHNNGGGNKSVPSIQIKIGVLNPTGDKIVRTIVLEGVWISKLGKISLKYNQGGGEPIKAFPIEFRYQYNYIDSDNETDTTDPNPLGATKK